MRKTDLDKNPINQFSLWFKQAETEDLYLPEAMTIATVGKTGKPSVRSVLLKRFNEQGFVFFTNYESRKGKELLENPYAALLLLWSPLHRQVRIEGTVKKTTQEESCSYFKSRPRESQLGAWASKQSAKIKDRKELENRFIKYSKKYNNKSVDCPPFWGGFRLIPDSIEFWQGRKNRLHDRFLYYKEGENWKITRLAP